MKRHGLICAVAALAINGCTQEKEPTKPRSATGQLEFLQGSTAALYANLRQTGVEPSSVGQVRALDEAVGEACGLTPPPEPGAPAPASPSILASAAVVVVGWAIDYLVSQASAAAQKQLAEYSAVTSGGLQFGSPELTGFYQTVGPPTMAWKCLRFSRKMQADKAAGSIVAMEAIFKVEVASSQDLLLLTPLRLYFDRPVALAGTGNDSKFGVSLGATFGALWQMAPTGEGKSARIWSSTILSQKIDGMTWKDDSPGTTRQRFYYYNVTGQRQPGDRSDATNKPVQVPLVPWSVNRKAPFGSGALAVTFAEVGDPPAILQFVAGLLKDHGKEIGDFLKDAAKKAMSGGN